MTTPTHPSHFGARLLATLPAVYRSRDTQGELAAYLNSFGAVLDGLHAHLLQRLEDSFPDTCQDWLLPYFAQGLDVPLRASDVPRQRLELAQAVAWRQAKGTLRVAREITQTVGGLDVVALREGWQQVLRTARIGETPHRTSLTASVRTAQRGLAPQDDPRLRSVDTLQPSWQRGHHHPKRLLIFVKPPAGFVQAPPAAPDGRRVVPRLRNLRWSQVQALLPDAFAPRSTGPSRPSPRSQREAREWVDVIRDESGTVCIRRRAGVRGSVQILGEVNGLLQNQAYRFDGLNLLGELKAPLGTRIHVQRGAAQRVAIQTTGGKRGLSQEIEFSKAGHWSGGIALHAVDCLIESFSVPRGLVQLQGCTVLADSVAQTLNASDCLFMGTVRRDLPRKSDGPAAGCLRYSRLAPTQALGGCTVVAGTCCTDLPVFYSLAPGAASCAVLHPATPASIRQGAEDGAELGAFHHRRDTWDWDATLHKLAEHMPLGRWAVQVPAP